MKIDFKGQGGFKMIKRMSFFFSILFVCCFVQVSMAQENDVEINLRAEPASPLTYSYVEGHEGDETQIKGFSYDETIFLSGSPVATGTVIVDLLKPPLNLTSPFIVATFTERISIFGGGALFDSSGYIVASTYTTSASTGEVTVSRIGSIRGTGDFFPELSELYGLLTSWGTANFLPVGPAGSMYQIWRVRIGY